MYGLVHNVVKTFIWNVLYGLIEWFIKSFSEPLTLEIFDYL